MAPVALLLLALQAAAPPLPPALARAAAEIRSELEAANRAVLALGHCAQDNPRHAQASGEADRRYFAVQSETEALFGEAGVPDRGAGIAAPQCGPLVVARFVRLAASGTARAEAALRRHTAAMPGLWFGPLHLCGGAVAQVTAATDESGRPNLVIALAPAMAAAIAAETSARVGKPLPIRLDGRVIAAPRVNEPITGGQIQLSPSDIDAAALSAAAGRACTADAGA